MKSHAKEAKAKDADGKIRNKINSVSDLSCAYSGFKLISFISIQARFECWRSAIFAYCAHSDYVMTRSVAPHCSKGNFTQ